MKDQLSYQFIELCYISIEKNNMSKVMFLYVVFLEKTRAHCSQVTK